MAHAFTDAKFQEEVLNSPTPVLVDFWATWCPPCRIIGPIIEELSQEIDPSKLVIGKLDVDANNETSMKYGVMSIPTLLVFKNGEVVEKIVGAMPKEELVEKLSAYIK